MKQKGKTIMMSKFKQFAIPLTLSLSIIASSFFGLLENETKADDNENIVNLYSYRQPFLINPLLEEFTKQTGIKANVVFVKKGMLERLKAEGENSEADLVLTADIGRLNDMVQAGILQSVTSENLNNNIPAQYRHPDGLWYGLTVRARIIFASKDRTQPGEVTSLSDLAKPALRERVCTRSGKHVYNVSLIASVIAHEGIGATKDWLAGLRENLAQKPQGNDRAQAKAISEGVCDYAVANTYYMGKMVTNEKKPEQQQWSEAIRIIFPDQNGRGTHVNVSGAAVTKSAKHADNAIRLIEFLSDNTAQKIYAEQNFEYPVKPGVELHPLVASWGTFKADTVNLDKVAQHRAAASKLVDETAFDLGPQNSY
jgi:iron(III) transport system substrate-binding protein